MLLGEISRIDIFETVKRSNPSAPKRRAAIDLGLESLPNIILPNKACTTLAVGTENTGKGTAQGSVTLVRDFLADKPKVTDITLDVWDDDYILRKGLHMPLTKKALEYWGTLSPIADAVDFEAVLANYRSGIFLHPKKLAWSGDNDEELLVNLQENNGLVRINATSGTPTAVASYGVKDHSIVPVDINKKDKTCDMKTYQHVFAMRNPGMFFHVY